MRLLFFGLLAWIAIAPAVARAEDDPDTAAALAKTQELLKDPAKRSAAVRADPAAKDADAKVKAVAKTDADSQAIYELSAEMMKLLEEAQANPEKFAEKLTPEQRARLEQIAKQIEGGQPASTPPAKP